MKKLYTIVTKENAELEGALRKEGKIITPVPEEMENELYNIDRDYFEYDGIIEVYESTEEEIKELPDKEEDYNCYAGLAIFGDASYDDICLESFYHQIFDDKIIVLVDDETEEGKKFHKTVKNGSFYYYY